MQHVHTHRLGPHEFLVAYLHNTSTLIIPTPQSCFSTVDCLLSLLATQTRMSTAMEVQGPSGGPPPYHQRQGWVPRFEKDYGGGGAFPEIHVAQYPLGMGRKLAGSSNESNSVLSVQLNENGEVQYDAIVKQQHRSGKIVQSQFSELVPIGVPEEENLLRPSEEEEKETAARTQNALSSIVDVRIKKAHNPNHVETPTNKDPQYIRYTPSQQGEGFTGGAQQRVVRLVEQVPDPLEPPKFKHKRLPGAPSSPPAPALHSPQRKITAADMENWKIPPCNSNWKNRKGYVTPLDKRELAARAQNPPVINDKFAQFAEGMYIAERNARDELEQRTEIRKKLALQEKEEQEEMVREMARRARMERGTVSAQKSDADREAEKEAMERDKIRDERKRERERDRRMENAGKKTKLARDRDRDISEKIALGQVPANMTSKEALFDQRLFNQQEGLSSGFNDDESYSVYDKPLFQGSSANQIYRPKTGDEEIYGTEEDLEKLKNTSRFKPDKGFSGADANSSNQSTGPRAAPVEFEKEEEAAQEADPFGVDQFLQEVKSSARDNK